MPPQPLTPLCCPPSSLSAPSAVKRHRTPETSAAAAKAVVVTLPSLLPLPGAQRGGPAGGGAFNGPVGSDGFNGPRWLQRAAALAVWDGLGRGWAAPGLGLGECAGVRARGDGGGAALRGRGGS